jgi:hypothetical protein
MPAGRPLEPAGDGRRRWMAAGRDAARRPVHRIRLTGQLVRPALGHLRQRREAARLASRNALAISQGFSILLDVRRLDDGPRFDLARWDSCASRWPGAQTRCLGATSPLSYRLSLPQALVGRSIGMPSLGEAITRAIATDRCSERKVVTDPAGGRGFRAPCCWLRCSATSGVGKQVKHRAG